MSVAYHAVGWNRQKRMIDFALAGLLGLALVVYATTLLLLQPLTTPETLVIRFTSVAALVLLHVILSIGPLARLDPRFLPLLYNRRHFGVAMFALAFCHGAFAIFQFHAAGNLNPFVSVLVAYARDYFSLASGARNLAYFPFEVFGILALLIFALMAATSHDFWLKRLGPLVWKSLHMLVYAAYGLVLVHVALGALQSQRSPVFPVLVGIGFVWLMVLHGLAFLKERRTDRLRHSASDDGYERVAGCGDLVEGVGRVVVVGGERVGLFLHEGRIFAISNVCRHQGGPLGEGRIVNGCLTCPWHGYQYKVEDGCSPPPFTEVVPTYPVRVVGEEIYVSRQPLPLGTRSPGVVCADPPHQSANGSFYIGWQSKAPGEVGSFLRRICVVMAVLVAGLFFGVAVAQAPVDVGTFEFGIEKEFEGRLVEEPLPLLVVGEARQAQVFLLVGAGKFGPPEVIRGAGGAEVRFQGSLIEREGVTMIEMNRPASFRVVSGASRSVEAPTTLGRGSFVGELVDTKCFLGVMRPATGKVHRGCAARCLSGGVPPGLLVRDGTGTLALLVLTGHDGQPLSISSELAARRLAVTGILSRRDRTLFLEVETWKLTD